MNAAVRNLGEPTIHVDDDPNTIGTVQALVGGAHVLVSTPEEVEFYTRSRGLDSIKNQKSGPIFQKGVDGDTMLELAHKAYDWWRDQPASL